MNRKTIKNIIEREGIALHTGKMSKVVFKPGNSGIVFYKEDCLQSILIQ